MGKKVLSHGLDFDQDISGFVSGPGRKCEPGDYGRFQRSRPLWWAIPPGAVSASDSGYQSFPNLSFPGENPPENQKCLTTGVKLIDYHRSITRISCAAVN